mmetsp:Transcript_35619/g.76066  ORF Transcript_35619/g.76066 Transcript_35619/m.76066 type:complete len:116 (-) Transcript_35619:191-538(-)
MKNNTGSTKRRSSLKGSHIPVCIAFRIMSDPVHMLSSAGVNWFPTVKPLPYIPTSAATPHALDDLVACCVAPAPLSNQWNIVLAPPPPGDCVEIQLQTAPLVSLTQTVLACTVVR